MGKRFGITLFFLTFTLFAGETYIVSKKMGNDANPGTRTRPFKTMKKALSILKPGDTLYIRAGTYPLGIFVNTKASPQAPITIAAYPNEKVLFRGNGSARNNDFRIRGNWIIIKNIELMRSYNGLVIEKKGSHNIIENVTSHHNHFSGFMLTRGAAHNTLINCKAHDNFDKGGSLGDGGNADGFGTGSRIGNDQYIGIGNTFINCSAWHNSDDGFDFWRSGNPVTIIGCKAYENGLAQGDGNGFKLGPENPVHPSDNHIVINSRAWRNRQNGFDYNDNKAVLTLSGNIAYANGTNYKLLGNSPHILVNNISVLPKSKDKLSHFIVDINNHWNLNYMPKNLTAQLK